MNQLNSVASGQQEALSASQRAYERLRRIIVTVEVSPGSTLSEARLMEQLEVGRTPLREALRRLSDDGFVTIYPRRGLVVRQLGLADAQNVFDSRSVIESANARSAAVFLDAGDAAKLQDIVLTIRRSEEEGNFMAFMERDKSLHLAIAAIAGNQLLTDFTDRLLSLTTWLWFTHLKRFGVRSSDFASHQYIVDAIYRRDGDAASLAMTQHIQISRELLRLAL